MTDKTKDADNKEEAPEVLGEGFCRGCRKDVRVIAGKKGEGICELCEVPRVDGYY